MILVILSVVLTSLTAFYKLPLHIDELFAKGYLSRIFQDGFVQSPMFPNCYPQPVISIPYLLWPGFLINALVWGWVSNNHDARLVGVLGYDLIVILFVSLLWRQAHSFLEFKKNLWKLSLLCLYGGSMFLAIGRPEQLLSISYLVVMHLVLSQTPQGMLSKKTFFIVLVILLQIWSVACHVKAVFMLPFFMASIWIISRSRFVASAVTVFFIVSSVTALQLSNEQLNQNMSGCTWLKDFMLNYSPMFKLTHQPFNILEILTTFLSNVLTISSGLRTYTIMSFVSYVPSILIGVFLLGVIVRTVFNLRAGHGEYSLLLGVLLSLVGTLVFVNAISFYHIQYFIFLVTLVVCLSSEKSCSIAERCFQYAFPVALVCGIIQNTMALTYENMLSPQRYRSESIYSLVWTEIEAPEVPALSPSDLLSCIARQDPRIVVTNASYFSIPKTFIPVIAYFANDFVHHPYLPENIFRSGISCAYIPCSWLSEQPARMIIAQRGEYCLYRSR